MNRAPSLHAQSALVESLRHAKHLTYYAERKDGTFLEIVDMLQGESVMVLPPTKQSDL
jgi:hypothetical protein